MGSVAGVVPGVFAVAKHIAAVAAVRVFEDARVPLARWDVGDVECAVAIGVPSFEFDYLLESEIGNQVKQVMRHDERGRGSGLAAGLPRDGAQRLAMEVIEVSVRDQDNVHWRQVAQIQSRLPQAL